MWKTAAAGAAVLVIAGSMIVYAQQRPGSDAPRDMQRFGDWRPSAQDLAAFADARVAALHAGLQLNADQEKNWPAFEQALREAAKMRIERLAAAPDDQQSGNPIERLQRRADAVTARGAALKRVADAAAPLYQSLDDAQKRRFAMLARFMRPGEGGRMHRMMMWRERFGDARGEFGGRGGPGAMGGMQGQRFHMNPMGPHGFGDDPHGFGDGMRNPHGMGGGMGGRDDDEDYRGPL